MASELIKPEQPPLFQRTAEEPSFLSLCQDQAFRAWSEEVNRKARQVSSHGAETSGAIPAVKAVLAPSRIPRRPHPNQDF